MSARDTAVELLLQGALLHQKCAGFNLAESRGALKAAAECRMASTAMAKVHDECDQRATPDLRELSATAQQASQHGELLERCLTLEAALRDVEGAVHSLGLTLVAGVALLAGVDLDGLVAASDMSVDQAVERRRGKR